MTSPLRPSLTPQSGGTGKNQKSTLRALSSILLAFESFIVFFATLAAFGLQVAPPEQVWSFGLGLAFACILAPAVLRSPIGYGFGWLLQFLILGTGFWLWGMWLIGIILLGLWIWAQIIGITVDKARTNYQKIQETMGANS